MRRAAHHEGVGRVVELADLGATVHLDGTPPALLAELPDLYSSMFCTPLYFDLFDHPRRTFACELRDPRHVLVFTSHGATAEVLDKVIDIEPASIERAALAIFRARPEIRRVKAEIKFPPVALRLPSRTTLQSTEHAVALPGTREEYEANLGTATRRNLRKYRNRLERAHPDFRLRVVDGPDVTLEGVQQVFDWNEERIRAKGEDWAYEEMPFMPYRVWRLVQAQGVALCADIDERWVAGWLLLFIGRDCWAHTAGFDPAYLDEHLGLLMASFAVSEAITRGCRTLHLGWGTATYKERLGTRPTTAWRVSIYRSRLDRALYARERWSLEWRHRNDHYWRLRKMVKRQLLWLLGARAGAPSR